jgi:hypothetical protein
MVRRSAPQIDWMLTLPGKGDPSSIIRVPERKIGLGPAGPDIELAG